MDGAKRTGSGARFRRADSPGAESHSGRAQFAARPSCAQSMAAPHRFRRREAARDGRIDSRARSGRAAVGTATRRRLRADRGREAAACGAIGGAPDRARGRSRHERPRSPRGDADRESAARRSFGARRSGCVRAARSKISVRLRRTSLAELARVGLRSPTPSGCSNFPQAVRDEMRSGRLSAGHARALLALESPIEQTALARDTIRLGLSVRQLEARIRSRKQPRASRRARRDLHVADVEKQLMRSLGTRVRLQARGQRGRIVIEFYSPAELERLLERLRRP